MFSWGLLICLVGYKDPKMYVTFFGSLRPISDLYALGGGSCRISKTCILTIFKMYVTFLPPPKAVGMFGLCLGVCGVVQTVPETHVQDKRPNRGSNNGSSRIKL